MKEYKGKTVNDRPVHGGEYVEKTGNAGERYNFYTCSDGIVRGFVETKHQNGCYSVAPKPNKLHIENLDSRFTRANSIDGVTVIFCARHPERGTVIIGWYEHA